ncbi:MAG: hypothetical protein M1479_07940 [Actinobacteria bacterium]|nr:hypothetical protein [Actinomycetota bacterium]
MPILTVNGKLKKEKLGVTLPHEHLFIDLRFSHSSPSNEFERQLLGKKVNIKNLKYLKVNPYSIKDNLLLSSKKDMRNELIEFKRAGGSTIVNQSAIGCGRFPARAFELSKTSSVNIVMGTGFYTKNTLPDSIIFSSEKKLLEKVLSEFHKGIGGTNIRPGIIGEVGIGATIEEWELKSLKITVKAQKETGMSIFVHIQAVPAVPGFKEELNGLEVINILEKNGADIERVVICHTDAKINIKYLKNILKTGAYIELEHFGKEFYINDKDFLMARDMERIEAVIEMINYGYIDKILISQDVCLKMDLTSYGGFGFVHILKNIVPILLKRGLRKEEIETILIRNPATILDINEKYL